MDVVVILVIILIVAVVWRGPKTLPQLGAMLGRGVRSARRQVDDARSGQGDGDRPS